MISQSVSESGISIAVGRKELDAVRSALDGELVRSGNVRHVAIEEEANTTGALAGRVLLVEPMGAETWITLERKRSGHRPRPARS